MSGVPPGETATITLTARVGYATPCAKTSAGARTTIATKANRTRRISIIVGLTVPRALAGRGKNCRHRQLDRGAFAIRHRFLADGFADHLQRGRRLRAQQGSGPDRAVKHDFEQRVRRSDAPELRYRGDRRIDKARAA